MDNLETYVDLIVEKYIVDEKRRKLLRKLAKLEAKLENLEAAASAARELL